MNALLKFVGALSLAAGLAATPAMAETKLTVPGGSTTGTYMDYMKTVYARASGAELLQLPLTSFDNEYQLTPLAAESWTMSEDGLTWTFKLREGLKWSDGEPLTAEDYVFALQRAATDGYDFAWYWDFAGGIKGWKEVTEGTAEASTLGLAAPDDLTLEITETTMMSRLDAVRRDLTELRAQSLLPVIDWGGAQGTGGFAFFIRVVQDEDMLIAFLILAGGIFGGHPIAVAARIEAGHVDLGFALGHHLGKVIARATCGGDAEAEALGQPHVAQPRRRADQRVAVGGIADGAVEIILQAHSFR